MNTSDSNSNGTSNAREDRVGATVAASEVSPTANARRRSSWPLAVVAALFVIVPFLAWYGTWFGRNLSDDQIEENLRDAQKARHVQHALAQVEKKISKGDAGARRWYPQIVRHAGNDEPEVRLTAAWVMGGDPRAEEFRAALRGLLQDREPIVRRNAALSLVRFNDASGREELRTMLAPHTVSSHVAGTALTALSEGSEVRRGAMLVRVRQTDGTLQEIRSPLEGKIERAFVKEGDETRDGQEIFVLSPHASHVADALVGLRAVGGEEDLVEVERYARGVEGMPESVKREAALTAEAIKRRSNQNLEGVSPR